MSSRPVRPAIDPSLTVDAVLSRWPAAVAALDAFGIDTCCGGGARLDTAAGEAGVPLADLVAAIEHDVALARGR